MGRRRALGAPILFVAALVVLCPSSSEAQRAYRVALDADRSVTFTSRASIEEFDGVTDRIDGFVSLNTESLTTETGGDDTEFYFEVDLASLDTGIGLRNRHMRDNYLEVAEYPYAAFGGRIARAAPLSDGAFRVTLQGTFGVHGVERDRAMTCDASPARRGYRVQCGFTVLLSDHDIKIPKVMFLKLNNEVLLTLDFHVEPVEGGE
jgi:polyisoprenoid-binding protein YceI